MMKKLFVIIFVLFISESCFSDGLDSNVVLLLHADNVGNGNFVDSSFSSKQVNSVGGIVSSEIAKFGLGSIYFDGIDDFLELLDSLDWFFFDQDLTIDLWVRFAELPSNGSAVKLISQWQDTSNLQYAYLYKDVGIFQSIFAVQFAAQSLVYVEGDINSIVIDVWYHLAYVRFGNNFSVYLGGLKVGEVVDSDSLPDMAGNLFIGQNGNSIQYFKGYIDELRISKGVARWTGNFTPPIEPYSTPIPTPTPTPTATQTPDTGTSTVVPGSANVDTGGLALISGSVLSFFGIIWGIRKLILLLNRS